MRAIKSTERHKLPRSISIQLQLDRLLFTNKRQTSCWRPTRGISRIFEWNRFDIGINTEFEVQLAPLDNRPANSQSFPAPIILKGDKLVELALLHKYAIITTLPFSKYASPIFAQRKPNEKQRLLVDLRKINTLIADDYINNNHPVSTLTDAAQHMATKNFFCKLDCFQAYHCLHMADQQSIELLAFNFASRTFAYQRMAQRFSRSLSVFLNLIREYFDPVMNPINVQKMSTILALPPIRLSKWSNPYEQFFSACGKLALNSAWPNAALGYKK